MNPPRVVGITAGAAAVLIVLVVVRRGEVPACRDVTPVTASPVAPAVAQPDGPQEVVPAGGIDPESAADEPGAMAARAASPPDRIDAPPAMNAPRRVADAAPEAVADFDQIGLMLRDYRTLTGENPVGTNAEIMKSIMGGNPKGATLGPPEGQVVNERGELIDRWGTPYFFHQLTKDHTEIRSAGPDRRMWNEDDLIGE